MKVYQILATIVVEDDIDENKFKLICEKNHKIQKLILEDYDINGKCNVHYKLMEVIDFPDLPKCNVHYDEILEEKYDQWFDKAEEVMTKYKIIENK